MLVLTNCNNNKSVYWCGDHPCVNKKEKENYFKETMIVEVKTLNKKSKMSKSDFQKIKAQAKANSKKIDEEEKNLAKLAKLEEKRKAKEEKRLLKQSRLEAKKKIKEEKKLKKITKKQKKTLLKKDIKTPEKKITLDVKILNVNIPQNKFDELVKGIMKRNATKPYPDINNIGN